MSPSTSPLPAFFAASGHLLATQLPCAPGQDDFRAYIQELNEQKARGPGYDFDCSLQASARLEPYIVEHLANI